ncbi:SAM binding motif-containing protein [Venturia nashicola]|uniref:SAM binding motif-containing protein n=1 Tax=Venturia nashicola TaxID=86259 RepID=A0A4Z1NNG2_9PEZI|nr:SAM binding motif-containing protein [Venturia nashicola]TLD20102.1 SAM binding motif-containing protein [Venturia nashicola]
MSIQGGSAASLTSSSSSISNKTKEDQLHKPYFLRHGRRYLRHSSYPLPCDLPELQRQTLQTFLSTRLFGKALCSPFVQKQPPRKVLEIACGTGYWSSLCHDYLSELGCLNVSFTGLDIVHVAPDLQKQGINWKFVQHDVRNIPLPFEDEQFDLVLLKDLSMVVQLGTQFERLLDDAIRILRSGGVLEIWETDHTSRSLQPHPPSPPGKQREEHECALRTGTFLISAATPFLLSQNKLLQEANGWIQEAMDRRKLSPTPCTRMLPSLLQEPFLQDIGFRRIAIPYGELRWEKDILDRASNRSKSEVAKGKTKRGDESALTEEQSSLRATALLILVQFIESLEPVLREVSGKNREEWERWWNWMITDLYENGGANAGDCLEMGAYWARKV